jgi:hypothetical protein
MSKPVRLAKQDNNQFNVDHILSSITRGIEAWVLSHALLCIIVAMCLLMALFVALIFVLTGVSAVESGTVYNGMERII